MLLGGLPVLLAHITQGGLALPRGQGVGRFMTPIKPSQGSHKQHLIFDDLKGLVPEAEARRGGRGGDT